MIRPAMTLAMLTVTLAACATAGGAETQRRPLPDSRGLGRPPMVNVWIGGSTIFRQGERAPVYFRTNRDAYVTVVRIDTDGRLSILYPEDPYDQRRLRAGRTYAARGRAGAFRVYDRIGLGYVFAIASDRPFDYHQISRGRRWDYMYVRHARHDPFEAMHDLAEMIVWDRRAHYALDFAEYHVGRRAPYPRYMCLDAIFIHSHDPYINSCGRFAVVYRTSPYRYGHARYYGYHDRVVYVRQPVRYPRIEQKSVQQGPPGGAPVGGPAQGIDRRRVEDQDDPRRGTPTNEPRRIDAVEGRSDIGSGRGTPEAPPRREPEAAGVNRTPADVPREVPVSEERTRPADPRAAPRRTPEGRDAEPTREAAPAREAAPSREAPAARRQAAPPSRDAQPAQRPAPSNERSTPRTEERREESSGAPNAPERRRRTPE